MSRYFILLFLCVAEGFAALSSNTVWEVQSTGNDNNAGAFVAGSSGNDYTQGAYQQVVSWLASGGMYPNNLNCTNASPSVCSSASRNFIPADVGNCINFTAGTNVSLGRHCIVSVASNNATMEANIMTGAPAGNATGYMGGALFSWGGLGAVLSSQGVPGMQVWIKKGTFPVTSTAPNVANGTIYLTVNGIMVSGYNSSRGDLDIASPSTGNAPLIQAQGGGITGAWTFISNNTSNANWAFKNLSFDAANLGSPTGAILLFTARTFILHNVKVVNCTAGAVGGTGTAIMAFVEITGCSGTQPLIGTNVLIRNSRIHDNTQTAASIFAGFSTTSVTDVLIDDNNSGPAGYGIQLQASNTSGLSHVNHVTCYNIGSSCVFISSAGAGTPLEIRDIVAEAPSGGNLNTSKPVLLDASSSGSYIIQSNLFWYNGTSCSVNCGVGSSFAGSNARYLAGPSVTTGSGTAFVNAGVNNFALNGGVGASLESLKFTYPGSFTDGYADAGAVQHLGGQSGAVN